MLCPGALSRGERKIVYCHCKCKSMKRTFGLVFATLGYDSWWVRNVQVQTWGELQWVYLPPTCWKTQIFDVKIPILLSVWLLVQSGYSRCPEEGGIVSPGAVPQQSSGLGHVQWRGIQIKSTLASYVRERQTDRQSVLISLSNFLSWSGCDIWWWHQGSSYTAGLGIGGLWPYMATWHRLQNPTLYCRDIPTS